MFGLDPKNHFYGSPLGQGFVPEHGARRVYALQVAGLDVACGVGPFLGKTGSDDVVLVHRVQVHWC